MIEDYPLARTINNYIHKTQYTAKKMKTSMHNVNIIKKNPKLKDCL